MSRSLLSPFAHLGRRSAAADDKDEDDKNKSKSKAEDKDDDDEDDKKDKDKKDDDAKSKSKSKAESDDDKKKDDDEDDDKSKSKKAKADDDEDDTSASAKAARARERSRIRAIMVSEAGMADPVAAAHVALDTDMSRDQAIGMLTAMHVSRAAAGATAPAGNRDGLRGRMDAVPNAQVGADGGASNGPSMAERIISAGKKARGEA